MESNLRIRELNEKEMLDQYSLVVQLSPEIEKKEYERMVRDMVKQDYRMIGAFDQQACIGVSGFWINTKLYCDRYLEPDNVVSDKNYRSKGVGKMLMDWLTEEAKRCGCKTIILDAYVENSAAHRFYFREGFITRGFHFLKKI